MIKAKVKFLDVEVQLESDKEDLDTLMNVAHSEIMYLLGEKNVQDIMNRIFEKHEKDNDLDELDLEKTPPEIKDKMYQ